MKKLLLTITLAVFAVTALSQGRLELRAILSGGKGKVVWKTRDQVGQLQAELSVEAERLAPGRIYRVFIGANTWQVTTNAFGAFHFERRYLGPARPSISAGTIVQIKNAAGQLILTGTFQ